MGLRQVKFQEPVEVKDGWLTIYCGPPMSGKSTEARKRSEDPNEPPFVSIEGSMTLADFDEVTKLLNSGHDVIYETTRDVTEIPLSFLERADTIEIFKRDQRR